MNEIKKMSLATIEAELDSTEMVEIRAGSGCGNDTMACVGYIYGGMGFLSAVTGFCTGICPAVYAAAVADCAVHNCF